MDDLVPTIGLEVHCQLSTQTKMFCGCPIVQGASPNSAVCPVCLGHPGALPVVNDAAVRLGVRAGMAVGCTINDNSIFARKHYFYPDLPKGYQISQFDRPLCSDGLLHVRLHGQRRAFQIERIHLEEDAGKLIHDGERSLIDWNRGGTPLIEIVGRPDIRSAEEAEAWLRMMHRVMTRARVTSGDMEQGHFRCDANVSVGRENGPLGTRVEIKNLNSFRFVARAIRHEIDRQKKIIADGGRVIQSTRSWSGSRSVELRSKEDAADYRYFPDPDLGPIPLVDADRSDADSILDAVPLDVWLLDQDLARMDGFQEQYGLSTADSTALLGSPVLCALFEEAVGLGGESVSMSNWVRGPVARWINEHEQDDLQLKSQHLVDLEALIEAGTLSRSNGRELIADLCERGGDVAAIVSERGLTKLDDTGEIKTAVVAVMAAHPDELRRYRGGQKGLFGFFMGVVMREFQGRADPGVVRAVLQSALD
ncbi:MAG: Asp-tRNA(Asn)/Glu-tRNA(Gln) amidotransferase subunit GatB, partial [Myxococcota bacterium]